MPSTLKAVATVAGCAALTAATLVVTVGPAAADVPTVTPTSTHGKVGSTLVIDETGFPASAAVTVSIGGGSTAGSVDGTSSTITVKVPSGATTSHVVVTDSADALSATSTGKFTVDPTPVPAKRTRLALAVSKSSVTYPGTVSVTAMLTAAGHAVTGLAVRLEHQTRGSSTWHRVTGTATAHTKHAGLVHWTVTPSVRGAFRAVFAGTKAYRAATSSSRVVGVRPRLTLSLPSSSQVLLTARARGRLSPQRSGVIKLEHRAHHRWQVVTTTRAHHGRFTASIPMPSPGTDSFRVVRAADTQELAAASPVASTHVVAPTLRLGSSGAVVAALQRRLHALHYDVGSLGGRYGWDAEHAVTAFEKIQGISKDGVAGPGVFARLASPKRIHLKHTVKSGVAVEVNLNKQVLLISKHGKLWRILDTSTAGGYLYTGSNGQTERAVTPRGHFHVVYKVDALVHARLGTLFRPSFFNYDGYAIHGEGNGDTSSNVPPFPASHGCVRITDNAVNRYYSLFAVGTSVWIYG